MDKKIKNYQKIILAYLQEEANDRNIPNIEFQVVVDKQNHHLQLIETGWLDKRFIHSVLFHFQIKPTGKVWLLANNTDILVAEELVKRGIPASDMVIGFHPVAVREFSRFAVA